MNIIEIDLAQNQCRLIDTILRRQRFFTVNRSYYMKTLGILDQNMFLHY